GRQAGARLAARSGVRAAHVPRKALQPAVVQARGIPIATANGPTAQATGGVPGDVSAPLLVVEGLRKAFGGLHALAGVDLSVDDGEIVGLIGPNGSGKTTFFNVLTGYYRPDGGRVRLAGQALAGCRPVEACRRGIARPFQL